MRVLIAGLGSIGQRHLANIRRLYPDAYITAWRHHARRDSPNLPAGADSVVYSLEAALEARPQAALIATPAPHHVPIALDLVRRGVSVFIEKPISDSIAGVAGLLELSRKNGTVLMVGYPFRFDPCMALMRRALIEGRIGRPMWLRAEVGQYLPLWRPSKDYRGTVSARKDLGGGVVLELTHELDYVRWLVGEAVSLSAHLDRLSDLEIDVEDTAEIILKFRNGVVGSVHLDMIQQPATRYCRLIGTHGVLTWNYGAPRVELFSTGSGAWSDLEPETDSAGDMYVAEVRHFFDCIAQNREPRVNGCDGLQALRLALAVKQSALEQRTVLLRKRSCAAC